MRKLTIILGIIVLTSCAEMQQVINQLPQTLANSGTLSQQDIGAGLKAALDKGINYQVTRLTQKNGFFGNDAVRILLPDELKSVDNTLRKLGLGKLADEGIKILNRAAENAVKEAIPIFSNAVRNITFNDAKNILLGADNAATKYLKQQTTLSLTQRFSPVIQSSFSKTGADKIWSNIIQKYNQIPFIKQVNPDLTAYTTEQALKGVFKMIAVEEKDIRKNVQSRTTDLLRKVFALQDNRQNTTINNHKF